MAVHIAAGPGFIEDTGARQQYKIFLEQYHGKKLLVLELGVGWRNQLIKAWFTLSKCVATTSAFGACLQTASTSENLQNQPV